MMTRTLILFATLLAACGPNRTLPERNAYQPGQVQPLTCVPNLDGQIDAAELPVALGVPIDYLVNPAGTEVSVDVAGRVDEDNFDPGIVLRRNGFQGQTQFGAAHAAHDNRNQRHARVFFHFAISWMGFSPRCSAMRLAARLGLEVVLDGGIRGEL